MSSHGASFSWRVSATMRTDLVLDALEQAIYARGHDARRSRAAQRPGRAVPPKRRLADAGFAPSVGSRGDADDNALAESVIGFFKPEAI